ncbi:FtsK/SpoIIIE domain-containing protein [Phytoactinopolyspora limicola]|uniref:FtsK/SpoIIIE domain-containing protein n=1 Tax=Phytoactinopolyspora limicola TaxID=2715536 RepID=UPI001A9C7904|nr:FtsK/SpoIIIE domain-containing protein [Phytoactinopolyspora limicola]
MMWRLSVLPSAESGLHPVDVVIAAQPGARVADLAQALGGHLGDATSGLLLAPHSDGAPWPAGLPLAEAGLRNGDVVEVAAVPSGWLTTPARRRQPRAVVRVLTGADAGATVEVHGAALTIGRGRDCTVVLADPLVSRLHARVMLAAGPVVMDEGSAHGTTVGGREVTRPVNVEWGEPIELGDTRIVLEPGRGTDDGRDVAVLRPPRFGADISEEELDVPQPPSKPGKQAFPWAMMLMPLMMGGAMFMFTQRAYSLVFAFGFPLMMLLNHQMQRRQKLKEHAEDLAAWRAELQERLDELDGKATIQRAHAEDDAPDPDVVRSRIVSRDRTLWTRRAGDADFLAVRVGRGPVPALVTAKPPRGGSGGSVDRDAQALMRGELAQRASLPHMPVVLPLAQHGLVAVAGAPTEVDACVRAMVTRLAATHSPADVSLAAVLGNGRQHVEAWLRWLPHTARRTGGVAPVAMGAPDGQMLLELLCADEGGMGHTVCLLDEDAGLPRRVVEAVAQVAAERRLHLVWMGADPDRVPASTGVLASLGAPGRADLTPPSGPEPVGVIARRDRGGLDAVTTVDALDLAPAWNCARMMTAYRDDAAVTMADTALPDAVRLPDLGTDLHDADDADALLHRWSSSRGLRAQLGAGADGVVTIDLRDDGPHGLVAGTTGAGKSELLQTLICSLALNNPPSRISFLLVDYKGGAAFRECADLPHTVGYITDLTPALVQRALTSLHAELTTREHQLAEYGAKDLIALERDHPDAAPPSMLIVVDEFAALLAEVPDFVDGMVNIAQRGRSLGMHMVLATQRPAGVVTPQIKANTDLRIALRVASTDDSNDVIDAPDAGHLSRRTPGRAWLRRTGHGTRELVQVAWVGAREPAREGASVVDVSPFTAVTVGPGAAAAGDGSRVHPHTDLERLVATTNTAFDRSGLAAPRRPWLPPLPAELVLGCPAPGSVTLDPGSAEPPDELRPADGQVLIGLVDRPAQQEQGPLYADFARSGHLLVYGASGSGKTELLRTLAAAATAAAGDHPPLVYGIDCGGGSLGVLETLPSVGSIVVEQAMERIQRMIRMLHKTVEDRNATLASYGVPDIAALAEQGVGMPRVYLLVDNLPSLVETLESGPALKRSHLEKLTAVLQEGRRCGVHVVGTSPRRSGVPSAMQAGFGQRIVLRMTAEEDYQMLGVPSKVLDADTVPGRGLLNGHEVQIATVGGAGGPIQLERLRALATTVEPSYAGRPAVQVPAMPTMLPPALVPAPDADALCVAVEAEYAGAVTLPLTEAPLLVAGRARSGRTSILAGLAELAARSSRPPVETVLLGPGVAAAAGVDVAIDDLEKAGEWAAAVTAPDDPADWRLVLVDDAHEWERAWDGSAEAKTALEALATLAGTASATRTGLVVTADPDEARSKGHVPGLVATVRRFRRAILLAPEMSDGALVSVTVPMNTLEPMSGPGRGLLCTPGAMQVVHVISAPAANGSAAGTAATKGAAA